MRKLAVTGAIGLMLAPHAIASDLDVAGRWYTPDKSSIVEIRHCGNGTPCGQVTWIDPSQGENLRDEKNRDENLRGRPMMGMVILDGFERGDGSWRAGAIYNPEDGRTYRARLQLLSNDALSVSGCLGPICKKLLWERADPQSVELGAVPSGTSEELASL